MKQPILEVQQVYFAYNRVPVIRSVSFSVHAGTVVGIIGPNGAGKSTLLKLLAGILRPQQGQILLQGKPLEQYTRRQLARWIGYLPQQVHLVFDFTAYDLVAMGRFPYGKPFGSLSRYDRQVIREAMETTEVWTLRHRRMSALSGGEQQRVFLASALAQQPQILLLDEPFHSLDLRHQNHFFQMLQNQHLQQGTTIIVVTHDVNLARRLCRQVLFLKEGQIVAQGNVDQIWSSTLLQKVFDVPARTYHHPGDPVPWMVFFSESTVENRK